MGQPPENKPIPPEEETEFSSAPSPADKKAGRTLLIGCGALAREVMALKKLHRWDHLDLSCLPAIWHNRPEKIAPAVRARIASARAQGYEDIKVLYGDCGTGGALDQVLTSEGIDRLPGHHCYDFFTGIESFAALHTEEPGSFFLTDYLARHFDTLIITGLGLDKHPQLQPLYFGHYKRLVYLAQSENDQLRAMAQEAAKKLDLAYVYRFTGYGELATFIPNGPNPNGPN